MNYFSPFPTFAHRWKAKSLVAFLALGVVQTAYAQQTARITGLNVISVEKHAGNELLGYFKQTSPTTWQESALDGGKRDWNLARRTQSSVFISSGNLVLEINVQRSGIFASDASLRTGDQYYALKNPIAAAAPSRPQMQSAATITGKNLSSVDVFDGPTKTGSIRQTNPGKWEWQEGQNRYPWREVSRSDSSVFISDGSSTLELNITRGFIFASDANLRTGDQYYALKNPTAAATASRPQMQPAATITGQNVTSVEKYAGNELLGHFKQTSSTTWQESALDGGKRDWSLERRTPSSVFISSEGLFLEINLQRGGIFASDARLSTGDQYYVLKNPTVAPTPIAATPSRPMDAGKPAKVILSNTGDQPLSITEQHGTSLRNFGLLRSGENKTYDTVMGRTVIVEGPDGRELTRIAINTPLQSQPLAIKMAPRPSTQVTGYNLTSFERHCGSKPAGYFKMISPTTWQESASDIGTRDWKVERRTDTSVLISSGALFYLISLNRSRIFDSNASGTSRGRRYCTLKNPTATPTEFAAIPSRPQMQPGPTPPVASVAVPTEARRFVGHTVFLDPNDPGDSIQPKQIGRVSIEKLGHKPDDFGADSVVTVAESFHGLKKSLGIQVSATGNYGRVSGSVESSYKSSSDTGESSYFASQVKQVFHSRYKVQRDSENTWRKEVKASVDSYFRGNPNPTDEQYYKIFQNVGTHLCTDVVLGGKLDLVVTMSKSTSMKKREISGKISAAYKGVIAGGEVSFAAQHAQEQLNKQSSFRATVYTKGGISGKGAKISGIDEEKIDAWISSVEEQPVMISYRVVGIWELYDRGSKERSGLLAAYQRILDRVYLTDNVNLLCNPGSTDTYLIQAPSPNNNPARETTYLAQTKWMTGLNQTQASADYVWTIYKNRDPSNEYNDVGLNYGDTFSLQYRSHKTWLSGNRGPLKNIFYDVYTSRSDSRAEQRIVGAYLWTVMKSPEETGSGPVAYGDRVHLKCGDNFLTGSRETGGKKVYTSNRANASERNSAVSNYMWTFQRAYSR